ncbi:MAG TPA: penicillin-binding protein 1A [Syntrophomonadaceae bacterium]|nr:penicillin-binding protein 1A [Syntrophomonadaceae bacterium]HQA08468.1 penicillin-binding protein 1A [Syntrophomonadaceae bacterium]HQE23530.1 penicillin-binding protein 1A [Syntrophomonadaceae bacterium]
MSNKKSAHSRPNNSSFWNRLVKVAMLLALVGAGCMVGVLVYAATNLPVWDPQQLTGDKATLIYDDAGNMVAGLHAGENRTEITLDQIPQDLINAFIATEDEHFYEHHGVNFKGIARAIVANLTSGDLTGQGASTITQQLARNAFLSFDKQWERKVKEIILAFKLESNYSKDEILTMYLNKINFGAGAYGVQAASRTYFGKDVSELSLAEASLLAGLPQSPNAYNPFHYLDRAKARQRQVLNRMVTCGYIDQATADEAYDTPLEFNKLQGSDQRYGYYIDAVIEEAITIFKEHNIEGDPDDLIYRSGYKIYTCMDSDLQSYAEELYANDANFPTESKGGQLLQSAMALMDHSNGQIKAIMGGRNYEARRGFNRATDAYRQPGSSIKPISVYSPALEKGFMPYYVLDDSPISYKSGSGSVWSPQNYDGNYRGLITMRTAVQYSINTYAVQMLDLIGIRTSFDFARSLGLELVDSPGTNDLGLAPLSLGGLTHGATPVQMAAAYGAIGNGGIYMKPHFIEKIVDDHDTVIYEFQREDRRVMSAQTAWLMGSMLQTVVTAGTGTNAQVPGVFTAGKTGTSEEYQDSWFCGFTPGYSVAVWMGYDQEYTMSSIYGGGFPAKIFKNMLQKAHSKRNPPAKGMPKGIVQVSVCSRSGLLPSDNCPPDQIITDYAREDAVPTETCDIHEYLLICPESGKLAGKYCPNPEMRPVVKAREGSAASDRIPTEQCDIHSGSFGSGEALLDNQVWICLDPRHNGELVQAQIPGPWETGGCPPEYMEKITLEKGQRIPVCNLKDHQTKRKKVRDVIDDIQDHWDD